MLLRVIKFKTVREYRNIPITLVVYWFLAGLSTEGKGKREKADYDPAGKVYEGGHQAGQKSL